MDVGIGYSPANCCWETRTNQCVNRRRFKTNTSGQTGVLKIGNLWRAHFQYERVRYHIGTFSNVEQAVAARVTCVEAFFLDREVALASLPRAPICETRRAMF